MRQIVITIIGIIVVSCSLTFLSLRYQQPPNCESYCWQIPCKVGQCQGIKAGFPFPFIFDDTAGSPVSGWGKIGREDFQNLNLWAFVCNFSFYSLLVVVIFKAIVFVKQRLIG